MPWPVHPNGLLGAQGDNDTYRIERSLRFNSADSANLTRTPSSATSRTVWTFSCWVKRSLLTSNYTIFSAGTSANTKIAFEADAAANGDSLRVFDYDGASFNGHRITTALFRDTSAWYHIVVSWNTAEAAADRIKIYVNGSQITSFSTNTNAGTGNTSVNNNVLHRIGQRTDSASGYFNGYLTEIHLIDGQALTPSSFGETDAITGRWKAKAYSGTYGTNGFYLKFADNSGTTSTTLGKDSSPNGNNWTPNNFSVTAGAGNDSLVDSPTNYGTDTGVGGEVMGNYCTLNPLQKDSNITITNGNLDATSSGNYGIVGATVGVSSGKWYWEITATGATLAAGIFNQGVDISSYLGSNANGWAFETWSTFAQKRNNNSASSYGSTLSVNDIVGVKFDADNGTLEFLKNNVSLGTAYSGLTSGPYFPAIADPTTTANINCSVNFGQRPFAYTAPTGFKALCTTNLSKDTAITTSGTFTGNASADGPFIWLNGTPTAMTINGNAVSFGTHADKLANGFKIRSSLAAYNASGSNTFSVTSTDRKFKYARAQGN